MITVLKGALLIYQKALLSSGTTFDTFSSFMLLRQEIKLFCFNSWMVQIPGRKLYYDLLCKTFILCIITLIELQSGKETLRSLSHNLLFFCGKIVKQVFFSLPLTTVSFLSVSSFHPSQSFCRKTVLEIFIVFALKCFMLC